MANEPEPRDAASDPATPPAALADLAYDHPELRAAIALNPATYDGLLDWLAALGDPDVSAALDARSRGTVEIPDPNFLRIDEAPRVDVGAGSEPLVLAVAAPSTIAQTATIGSEFPQRVSRRPAFLTKKFLLIIGSLIVVLVVGIVIATSAHNAVLVAQSAADQKAQQAAADKANAATQTPARSPKSTASPTSSPTPLPPPSIVPTGFNETWSQGFVANGGYTETVSVSVGTPESLGSTYPHQVSTGTCSTVGLGGSGCTTNTFTSGHTCTADKATDTVIPISVDTTSTTSAFSQVTGARLTFQSSDQLQYEAYYDSGAVCNDGSSGVLAESSLSTKTMKNGERTSLPMFLIVENYYTPDHPQGDASLLAGIAIYVSGSTTSSTAWSGDGKPVTHQTVGSASSTLPPGSALQLG